MSAPRLRIEGATVRFDGLTALDGVGFDIAPGDFAGLIGPNGAGKTTLLRCLAALEHPFSGAVTVDGLDVEAHPRECHARLGFLSDFFGLYDQLTARQCLTHFANTHGLAASLRPAALDEAARRLEIGDLLDQKTGTLSRGQRQRLAIAQALIHEPKVLLLDEPASGLDPEARWSLSSLLTRLCEEGVTIVVSSHILSELEDYSTDVMILREGRLVIHRPLAGVDIDSACIRIELTAPRKNLARALGDFDGVSDVALHGKSASVILPGGAKAQQALLKYLVEAGFPVCSFAEDRSRMQDVYLSLAPLQGDEAADRGGDGSA